MKVKWKYPHGECWLETPDDPIAERVNAYLEIPFLEKSLAAAFKNDPDGDIAFVVPIFVSEYIGPTHLRQVAVLGYIKRVFWLAYEMAHFTDLTETGTGFYIAIEKALRPLLEPYRQACEFPEDRILVISDLAGIWHRYMPKMVMLREACSRTAHQYYLNLDTGIHFPAERPNFCNGIQNDWNENPDRILIALDPWPDIAGLDEIVARHNSLVQYHVACLGGDRANYYTQMPGFFGLDTYEQLLKQVADPFIKMSGCLYGIPRTHIESEGFEDFLYFVKKTKCINYDESFLAFYWHRYLAPDQSYLFHSQTLSLDFNVPFFMFKFNRDRNSLGNMPYTSYQEYIANYNDLSNWM